MTSILQFRLHAPLQLPNRKPNLDWRIKAAMVRKARFQLAWEIRAALNGFLPPEPFAYASVQVFRHGIREPDIDNLFASAKDILDVMQPATEKRKFGLGIITDDKPSRCKFEIKHIQAKHRTDQGTLVVIRQLETIQQETAA